MPNLTHPKQLDFDKFDDPNFNPFETKTKVSINFGTTTPPPEVEKQNEAENSTGNILLDNVMKGKNRRQLVNIYMNICQ